MYTRIHPRFVTFPGVLRLKRPHFGLLSRQNRYFVQLVPARGRMDIAAHQGRASPARPARRPVARKPAGAGGNGHAGRQQARRLCTSIDARAEGAEGQSAPLHGGLTPSRRSRRSQGRSVCTACRPRTDRPPTRQSSPPSCQPRSLGTDVVPIERNLCVGCAKPHLGACPGVDRGSACRAYQARPRSVACPGVKNMRPQCPLRAHTVYRGPGGSRGAG